MSQDDNAAVPTTAPYALTTEQAAVFLDISRRTLEDWRLRGGGPPYQKFGRAVRYLRHKLIEFAEADTWSNTGSQARAA